MNDQGTSGQWVEPKLHVSVSQFRLDMPEFSDPTVYTPRLAARFLLMGEKQLDPQRWADMYVQGIEWFAAHFLALARRNSMGGAAPGSSGLPLSKTVGKASVDYDTSATTIKGGGPWNLTSYGTQLLWWAQLVGSGGIQITGDMTPHIFQEIGVDAQTYGFIGYP
jgi:hypothetical protein